MSDFFSNIFYKQRADFDKSTAERAKIKKLPEDIRLTKDISYGKNNAQRIDVYEPTQRPDGPLPVIINVHGGGMILGSKEFNSFYCANLCRHGFLVFSVEYRLIPDVKAFDQYNDLSRAMDFIQEHLLKQYHGSPEAVYLVADSGGANISIYAAAMQKNRELALAANVTPSTLKIKALGLISGMFYTNRFDKVGLFLPPYLYGKNYKRELFSKYINPSCKAVAGPLPACYLVTSHNDMLQRYTLDFKKALTNYHIPHKLTNYKKNKKLTHAFSVFEPDEPESKKEIEKMLQYFRSLS